MQLHKHVHVQRCCMISFSCFFQLCSIIVFGCVSDQLKVGTVCYYNLNNNCCNFAIAVGVLAFLLCLVFLMKDILYNVLDFTNNINVSYFHVAGCMQYRSPTLGCEYCTSYA